MQHAWVRLPDASRHVSGEVGDERGRELRHLDLPWPCWEVHRDGPTDPWKRLACWLVAELLLGG